MLECLRKYFSNMTENSTHLIGFIQIVVEGEEKLREKIRGNKKDQHQRVCKVCMLSCSAMFLHVKCFSYADNRVYWFEPIRQSMKKILPKLQLKKSILLIFFILLHILIIKNAYFLSKDVIFGDYSSKNVFPRPLYGYARVPNNAFTEKYEAENRLTSDFAQIYFPTQSFSTLSETYQNGYFDPWNKPSRYAPFIHFLCSITLCKLNYGLGSFLHIIIQVFIFYFFFIVSFRLLSIEKDLMFGLALANVCLFLTPAGLSWFERGQFSLYVSVSYLLLIVGLGGRNILFIILSALFAYVKWTSFPFIFVTLAIFMLSAKTLSEIKLYAFYATTFFLVILSLSLCFPEKSYYFLLGLYAQEQVSYPEGVSLVRAIPVNLVKIMPIALIILGYVYLRLNQNTSLWGIPFLLGIAVILLMYPTKAFEYNVPSLLCFIPILNHWERNLINATNDFASKALKYLFYLFLCLSLVTYVPNRAQFTIIEFFLIAILFLIFPLIYSRANSSVEIRHTWL